MISPACHTLNDKRGEFGKPCSNYKIAIVLTTNIKSFETVNQSSDVNQKYFSLDDTLMKLINRSKLKKKKRFGVSQLDKCKYELIDLRKKGATLEQLQDYLNQKGIRVVLSTISRWLNNHASIRKQP